MKKVENYQWQSPQGHQCVSFLARRFASGDIVAVVATASVYCDGSFGQGWISPFVSA